MLLNLTHLSDEPLHRQISRQLLEKILRDELASGSQLPNFRKLAREQHVNASVVERAYRELVDEGLLASDDGQRFVVPDWTTDAKLRLRHRLISESPPANVVQQLASELRIARQIQACLFPRHLPEDNQISVAADWQPASIIGGDFYDCFAIDSDHTAFVIADACGKGLPAAMLVTQIQAMLHSEARNGNGIRELLAHLNEQIIRFSPRNQFATLFYGILDRRNMAFRFAAAGHNPPLVVHPEGSSEWLKTGGPGLGILAQANFQTGKIDLRSGDVLAFYTDGITEAVNSDGIEFDETRLETAISGNRHQPPQQILEALLTDFQSFVSTDVLPDDRTVLILKIN